MNSFFQINNVSSGYSTEAMAIRDVNLTVEKNTICAILGSNGAGKTTLLKTIMGILPSYKGEIILDEVSLNNLSTEQRASLGIGYVPQGRFIFPQLTVEENLLLGCDVKNINKKQAKALAYEFFPALQQIKSRKGGMLSGGQQQQLAIARMLVMEPQLLILDEPAEGIQPNIVQNIGEILIKVCKEMDITVLLVEQFVSFALNISHSYYWMQSGEINNGGEVNVGNKKGIISSITL